MSPVPADLPGVDTDTTQSRRLSADGLGERWLVQDPTHGPLEILRLQRTFIDAPEFEARLRLRVDDLRQLRHPALAVARSVEWLDGGEGLGVVSPHVPGRRLADVLAQARGAAFALEFVRQVTPAVCAIQQVRPGFAHGLLTPDRIVVTRDGRLVIVDLPFAPAVESMRWSAAQLRQELGIAVPDAPGAVPLDPRLDVVQIGFIALALLLGRRLEPSDFRGNIPALMEEAGRRGADTRDMRSWLEQALQLVETPFECALDALEALTAAGSGTVVAFRGADAARPSDAETPQQPAAAPPSLATGPVAPPVPLSSHQALGASSVAERRVPTPSAEPEAPGVASAPATSDPASRVAPRSASVGARSGAPVVAPPSIQDRAPQPPPPSVESPRSVAPAVTTIPTSPLSSIASDDAPEPSAAPMVPMPVPVEKSSSSRKPMRLGLVHWVLIALAVVASVQAAAIAGLLTSQPTSPAVPSVTIAAPALGRAPAAAPSADQPDVTPAPAPAAGTSPAAPGASASSVPVPPPPAPPASAGAAPAESTPARAKPTGQVGGVRVMAPFDCQVFEAGVLIGTTAGPIALPEGSHDLELVNEAIALRVKQRIAVKPGELANVTLAVPNGRVNINAAPWASVSIDGTAAGDTPLANVSLPAGSHEFLFRHPQLGEQRIVALVKAEGVTRVSASFQR
ncbi:MAG: hypothetical protein IT184_01215 [Acidobacteria bacterium]|nr:hypothetical protein [Acidobacteriota bacterium]